MKPIERLAAFLQVHHPYLTIHDVQLHAKPGFLREIRTGLRINIQRAGYAKRDGYTGKYVSINQLWVDLHDYFNAHVKVEKVRKRSGKVTVINWQGSHYSFDKNQRKRDSNGRSRD